MRLLASYGTAFKAPSFNELYFPFFGNPDLDPEQSRSAELGVSGELQGRNWSVNAYQTDVDDLIVFGPSFTPGATSTRRRFAAWRLALFGPRRTGT